MLKNQCERKHETGKIIINLKQKKKIIIKLKAHLNYPKNIYLTNKKNTGTYLESRTIKLYNLQKKKLLFRLSENCTSMNVVNDLEYFEFNVNLSIEIKYSVIKKQFK